MGLAIGTSGADFRSRMKLVSERVKEQCRRKIVNYATAVHKELTKNTPILTGQARASWLVGSAPAGRLFYGPTGLSSNLQNAAHGPPQRVDYATANAQALAQIAAFQTGQVLYIYNSLPYIERLNAGYSRQAPAGFVESAILTAKASLKR